MPLLVLLSPPRRGGLGGAFLLLSVAVGERCHAGALLEEVGHGALVAQIIYFHRICLLLIYVVQNYKKNL